MRFKGERVPNFDRAAKKKKKHFSDIFAQKFSGVSVSVFYFSGKKIYISVSLSNNTCNLQVTAIDCSDGA